MFNYFKSNFFVLKSVILLVVSAAALGILLPTAVQPVPTAEAGGSEPFLAEVSTFGFNFAPRGWALCDGQLLPINQNQALFSILGTTYGGDGRTSFALPDLRGRIAIHPGENGISLGSRSGSENIVLTIANVPSHSHNVQNSYALKATAVAGERTVSEDSLPARAWPRMYSTVVSNVDMVQENIGGSLGSAGSGQQMNNMQPYLTVTHAIALQGIFPSR